MVVGPVITTHRGIHRLTKTPRILQNRQQTTTRETPDSPATRPDDLGVRSWYNEHHQQHAIVESPSSSIVGCDAVGGMYDRSSYPSSSSSSYPYATANRDMRSLIVGRPNLSFYSITASRERDSSLESNDPPVVHQLATSAPRKAYMDITDAIALLDETCPYQRDIASPSLTPKTPRTPLTPFPRSRRARSKSSDNSSNYSNDVTGADKRSLETSKSQEKQQDTTRHRRPFLRKIGISKTEDKPFLAKIIAPRIIGKPYLEKIGPSRAVEKPFLEKIGSSKTLDRFTFDALRELPRAMVRRCQPVEPSPLTIERTISPKDNDNELEEDDEDVVLCIIKDERDEDQDADDDDDDDDDEDDNDKKERMNLTRIVGSRRRSNAKGYLLKMYSFETEDLNDISNETTATSMKAPHKDPLRGTSLDDNLDSGPSSFPPSEDSHERASSRSDDRSTTTSVANTAELVKCRVTMSEEIFTTNTGQSVVTPREATSWGNSPSKWSKRRSRRVVTSATRTVGVESEEKNSLRIYPSDESIKNSPIKRRISPDDEGNVVVVVSRTKNSCLTGDSARGSPLKTRRQASNEETATTSETRQDDVNTLKFSCPDDNCPRINESLVNFARCKSRRQTFKEAVEKFGGMENSTTRTRRQVSEEILDRNRKNVELPCYDDPHSRFERRGISSDNLKLSRETMVASVPSTSSLGYQSGDSSLVSQRSSHHSQDFVRGTLKLLHDKFELQELPAESYAAFKRRTRPNKQHHHHTNSQRTNNSDIHKDFPRNDDTTRNNSSIGCCNNNNNDNPNSTTILTKGEKNPRDITTRSASDDMSIGSKSSITTKSVLRKQDRIDHQSDQETENFSSLRCPKQRRMINEPSQETMDLLTELRRVKSLLKTPSVENDGNTDFNDKPPSRFPKKILLTDKEFCLSVERDNSIRRRPSTLVADDDTTEVWKKSKDERLEKNEEAVKERDIDEGERKIKARTNSRRQRAMIGAAVAAAGGSAGPALFEKRCLSLDYADDDKPPKPEARAISLVASSRTPRSGTAGDYYDNLDSSDPAGLAYDARSYSSDVFTSPSDENDETRDERIGTRNFEETRETEEDNGRTTMNNHCAELDIAIPVDHDGSISPKRRIHAHGRTSDFYEIISPRSTPFRVKKRLGRISVEETVKQESFTLNKVDCRSVVTQKRTKCFPL